MNRNQKGMSPADREAAIEALPITGHYDSLTLAGEQLGYAEALFAGISALLTAGDPIIQLDRVLNLCRLGQSDAGVAAHDFKKMAALLEGIERARLEAR